jgi:putative PIN family toxin of toxin-antitoxin system
VVLDTSVLVAAIRSPTGASGVLVEAVVAGELRPLVSVPLALEYESVLTRPEHLAVSGFAADEAVALVKAFCKMGDLVHLPYLLRPQLTDPDDEFVLETAVHGRADFVVTFNSRDFFRSTRKFGIETISPRDAVRRMRDR